MATRASTRTSNTSGNMITRSQKPTIQPNPRRTSKAASEEGQSLFEVSQGQLSSQCSQNPTINGSPDRFWYLEAINKEQKIPSHPVEIGKLLRGKGLLEIADVTKLGKFRYKIDPGMENKKTFEKLDLTEHNLKIFSPLEANGTRTIFVRGVLLDFGDKELVENTSYVYKIMKVERIQRKSKNSAQLVSTANLKITVSGTEVPREVKIYGCNFRCVGEMLAIWAQERPMQIGR